MINFAVRYQPVLQELQRDHVQNVLEVGSGPEGLALFWRGRVTGADILFKRRPLHYPLNASALALPFASQSWPVVVSCDTLEHIPPPLRRAMVRELARVTQRKLLLAFPTGKAATECYAALGRDIKKPHPAWLSEHLLLGLPDAAQTIEWLREAGWRVQLRRYESAAAHQKLMYWESKKSVQLITYALMRLLGPLIAPRLPVATTGSNLLRALLIAKRDE